MPAPTKWLTTTQAAETLNISRDALIYHLENTQKLDTLETWVTPGGHRRISQNSITEYLDTREPQPTQ